MTPGPARTHNAGVISTSYTGAEAQFRSLVQSHGEGRATSGVRTHVYEFPLAHTGSPACQGEQRAGKGGEALGGAHRVACRAGGVGAHWLQPCRAPLHSCRNLGKMSRSRWGQRGASAPQPSACRRNPGMWGEGGGQHGGNTAAGSQANSQHIQGQAEDSQALKVKRGGWQGRAALWGSDRPHAFIRMPPLTEMLLLTGAKPLPCGHQITVPTVTAQHSDAGPLGPRPTGNHRRSGRNSSGI